jgi:restriction endonuclease
MTTKPTIQIGELVREMTDTEIAQFEKDKTEFALQAKIDSDRQKLKIATLAKLGLTDSEVAALLS